MLLSVISFEFENICGVSWTKRNNDKSTFKFKILLESDSIIISSRDETEKIMKVRYEERATMKMIIEALIDDMEEKMENFEER